MRSGKRDAREKIFVMIKSFCNYHILLILRYANRILSIGYYYFMIIFLWIAWTDAFTCKFNILRMQSVDRGLNNKD